MPDSTVASQPDVETPEDFLPINGTDYIEFYVGNAKQAAHYYAHLFGFQIKGYLGPETGHGEKSSYLLEQNDIRFVLTSALGPDSPISEHVHRHGDGVKDIALWVDDAADAFAEATTRGATPVQKPTIHEDEDGRIVTATIATYGDTVHTFVERSDYDGLFFPGFQAWDNEFWDAPAGTGLKYVDHCVGNVHEGDMDAYVEYYAQTMGFYNMLHFTDQDISTEYSALMSKVMANGDEKIKFPIN
ncbi:MAG: VOC family protein, partial [Salinibacter sp.]